MFSFEFLNGHHYYYQLLSMLVKIKPILSVLILAIALNACQSVKPVVSKPETVENRIEEKEKKIEEERKKIKEEAKKIEEGTKTVELQPYQKSPNLMREFRAAWVATVANINWPSTSGLSTKEQQDEALVLLDFLKEHNYNAVIFQVRPQADALYRSSLEPWSYFLTGEVGKAPDPYYDPLSFWIEAAHDRGMELHVWLNPYRSHHTTGGEVAPKSMVKTRPELMVSLANGMWWMDPSKQATQDHSSAVVMDIVKRYDIDGVHFDDYFYPYKSYNEGADFPDAESYSAYLKSGGILSKSDWRRAAVNGFVKRIYEEIKAEKPEVKFGLSPFGIWKPGYPASIAGMNQYEELYADAKLWLNEGWIDYFAPQLYWKINQTAQSFPVLLGWWESENTQGRHLWPGMNIDFGGNDDNIDETINQIMITRGMTAESKGAIHWSISPLLKYKNLSKALVEGPYKKQALVPKSPWLDNVVPAAPYVSTKIEDDKVAVSWTHAHLDDVFQWVVFYKYQNGWDYKILDRTMNAIELSLYLNQEERESSLTYIGVTAVDKVGNQSTFKEIKIVAK